jgi:H+/Cl- antiporter ClcA
VELLGHDHARGPRSTSLDWSVPAVLQLAVIGGLAGVIARVYVRSVDTLTDRARTWLPSRWMRTAIGGAATLLVALSWTRDALGLSLPLLDAATSGGTVEWWAPIVKLLLTVIAISTGWVGGEVVPLLVIGATAGSVVGDQLGMSTAVAGRAAGAATFHAAAGTAIAGVAMAAELWGWYAVAPACVASLAARLAAGRPDLYHTGQ